MPLDPSIIMGVKPPEIPDPQEFQNKSLTLQNLMQQREAGQLTLEKTRQADADEQAVRDAYQQSGGDPTTLRKLLTGRGAYKQIQALDKAELEKREKESTIGKNTAQGNKAQWEVDKERAEHGANLITMANPQNFEQIIRFGEVNKYWDKAGADHMRQQGYSPALVEMVQRNGLAYAKQKELEGQAQTRTETGRHNIATERTAAAAQAETGRHNVVTEGAAETAALPATVQAHSAATAAGKISGEAQATARANLPKTMQTADRAIRLIDEMVGSADGKIKPHPGFETAVGVSGLPGGFGAAGYIPGTDTSDFKARFEELQGGVFLQAFESLKGGGPITEIEGAKATAALNRMKLSQSEGEFRTAAREFQASVRRLAELQRQIADGGTGATAAPQGQLPADFGSVTGPPLTGPTVSEWRPAPGAYSRPLTPGRVAGGSPGGGRVDPRNLSDAELRKELGLK